jgi:hypothetical protein
VNFPAWSGQFAVIDWPFADRSSSKRRTALVAEEPDEQWDLSVMKDIRRRHSQSVDPLPQNYLPKWDIMVSIVNEQDGVIALGAELGE